MSTIQSPCDFTTRPQSFHHTSFTETRGDGPTRTFNYTSLHLGRPPEDTCPIWNPSIDPAPQQFLPNYTDFRGNRPPGLRYTLVCQFGQRRQLHTTSYLRGPPPNAYPGPRGIGQILKITYHDQTHVDYIYEDESPNISGHYVHSVSNERQKITTYTRDPITHRVHPDRLSSRRQYPRVVRRIHLQRFRPGPHPSPQQTALGRVLFMTVAALLTDKYNPKQSGVPAGSDPHTHYYYYTAADGKLGWIDRVKTVTLPANDLGHSASETYEYDRTLDASGITNLTGAAVGGRGLVTKITHGDNAYQQFKYDAYGNKRWEDNELRQASSYTYDDYNRLLTAKNPLNKTTNYTYTPTNGGGGSSYKHTTSNPDTVTTPTGIVTKNVYDQNFRKTSTTAADGTALAATTWFDYDDVGNQTYVTDPRGTSSPGQLYHLYRLRQRNRKWQVREPLGRTTQFYYDDGLNITRIVRPDTTTETKTYDALNRVLSDTVPKTSNPVVNLTTSFA